LDDCKAAKALGIDTVIIDDGWQTSDVSRGYGYCGDYRVAKEKISDMRRLVDNLHGLGMRAMLWYSVSFLGDFAQKTQKLKDKTLYHNDGSSCYVLDPRFAEVRRHIVESCIQAIKEWDFDGLKLDFIDAFVLKNTNVPIGADCVSLEEGIRKLLRELSTALGAIKPNVLIEFRQGYVGPAMRTLCNMIRVGDCPGSMLINRTGIVDLRLTSGNTAVHSDPLVWEKDATVEEVGRYFANVLFSVVQVSAAPSDLTEEQQKVVAQYVAFMKRHRKVLLESEFTFDGALENYPVIAGFDDHTKITGVYANALVGLEKDKEIVVNGGVKSVVTVKTDETYSYVAVDACGNKVGEGQISGLAEIGVPLGGMVELSVV
jgi:alpha-galactosidase